MSKPTNVPNEDELNDEALENVAGGAETTPKTTVKKVVKKTTRVEGESKDENHDKWIDITS